MAESHKPGFVPPRDLSKHSPLIKSQSLISIRRVRSREDGTEAEPARAPSPRPSRERRNVQRTQSVPAQNKAGRRMRKQSSAEHVAEPQGEDTPRPSGPHDATVSQLLGVLQHRWHRGWHPVGCGDALRVAAPWGPFGEGSRGTLGDDGARGSLRTGPWGHFGDGRDNGAMGFLWGRQGHGERLR